MKKLQDLKDELLELEIQMAGVKIEIAYFRLQQRNTAYFYFKGERDHWAFEMARLVKSRSPAQIERMEAARGLQP